MVEAHRVEGVVLCRVGAHRLALLSQEVETIVEGAESAPYAGRGFDVGALAPATARTVCDGPSRMAVDAAEVRAEAVVYYAAPQLLASIASGAVEGFVEAGGALWPVVSLAAFARYLETV